MIVLAIKKELSLADVDLHLARIVEVRGGNLETLTPFRKAVAGFLSQPSEQFDVNEWSARQVYLALGQFMAAAAVLGIDTCPLEGILLEKYDELLGLTGSDYATCVGVAAGYRTADDKHATLPKVRFPAEQVVRHYP
jgi:nitroreductase